MTDRRDRMPGRVDEPDTDHATGHDGYDGRDGYDGPASYEPYESYESYEGHADDAYDEHFGDAHLGLDGGADGGPRRGDRHAVREQRRAGPVRALRRLLVLLVAIALIVGAVVAAVAVLKPMVSGFSGGGDTDFPGPGSGAVTVVVGSGDTGRAIGQTLADAGVVRTAKAFSDAALDNPSASGIQPGTYTMKKEMKASDAVSFLSNPANRTVKNVTVREGLWKSEVFAALSKASGKPVSDYEAAAQDAAALGLPASAKGNVEGYLFPATYEFAPDSSAADQLKTMVSKSVSTLSSMGVSPDAMESTLITASILEAEGSTTDDRQKIARVLLNRLEQKMNLQLDSTVSYGVQKRSITTTDAARANQNPYNTYVNPGLPAGPIGNPGESAMQAALTPADGPWLFFVAVNPTTGETKFATTLAEHDQYVQEFQAWCSANPGQC